MTLLVHMGWLGEMTERSERLIAAAREFIGDGFMLHTDESMVPDRWKADLPVRMRSDIQRHAILKQYGGLWLDVDVRLVRHPMEWATWDRYTAICLTNRKVVVGTDIIFCPKEWDGWDLIDRYITEFVARGDKRIPVLALAHNMIRACQAERPESFTVLAPESKFPYDGRTFTTESVVARGYDPPADPPTFAQKMVNFASSAVRHVASGMPMCTQEQIDERFAICLGCEFYKDNSCQKCGCPVNRQKQFISKLSWANERCPIGKWGKVDTDS